MELTSLLVMQRCVRTPYSFRHQTRDETHGMPFPKEALLRDWKFKCSFLCALAHRFTKRMSLILPIFRHASNLRYNIIACFFCMGFGEDSQGNFHLPLRKNAILIPMHPTVSLHDLGNCAFYSFFPLTDNAKTGYPQPSALADKPQLHWPRRFESYHQKRNLQ